MRGSFKRKMPGYCLLYFLVLMALVMPVPVIGAENISALQKTPQKSYQMPVPFTPPAIHEYPKAVPSSYEVKNFTGQLDYWNKRMYWGLSSHQITESGSSLENKMQKKYNQSSGWFTISNYSEYAEDIGSVINLDEEQKLAFVYQNDYLDGFRMQFMEIPGYIPPEVLHFFVSGRVLDDTGRPVPNATVRFLSDLTVDGVNLTSTGSSDIDGKWRIKIAWGNHQNITVTREGYYPVSRNVVFSNGTNVMDFTLTPKPKAAPVRLSVILMALILAFVTLSRNKD